MQDYCDEYPGVTEEDIVKEFGTPTSVVSDYFDGIDEDYLFRKLKIRNNIRISISVITVCIIILNIFVVIFIIKNIRQLEIQILLKKKQSPS